MVVNNKLEIHNSLGDKDTLQNRYRPHNWDSIIGQEHIINILKGIIKNQAYKFTRSYIFHASPGSGKTTTARVLANAIICDAEDVASRPCGKCKSCLEFISGNYHDYIEVDAGKYNKVEDVARLIEIAKVYPIHANKFRIIVIDEAHRLSNAAWDSLLKLLEEGVTRTIFAFATTEGDKIRKAIHSRSLSFQMKPLTIQEIQKELVRICDLEGIPFEMESLQRIAYANRGKMRDALKTLDMFYRAYGEIKNIQLVTPEEHFCEILTHAFFNRIREATEILDQMVISGDQLESALCNTITAIYCFPHQIITGIPEHTLISIKSLFKNDIKRLIELFMNYKPATYEQIKLFLHIIAELGVHQSDSSDKNQTKKRQLIKKKESDKRIIDDEDL